MQFLIDTSAKKMCLENGIVRGQLLTPLTRYSSWGGEFAIDNGCFGRFRERQFKSLLKREENNAARCLFVCCPDVVGSGRRTLELFKEKNRWFSSNWPAALVAQDGIEDLEIPWNWFRCLFIGGTTVWKESAAVRDLVKTAKILGKHVHVGRVNTWRRFKKFSELDCDTCDGSGIAKYDHMMTDLLKEMRAENSQSKFSFTGDKCKS